MSTALLTQWDPGQPEAHCYLMPSCPGTLIERAELLAGELLTNAITHARSEAELRLTWARDTLRVAVWDTSPKLPEPVETGDDSEHGRGLHLLALLADRWDHFPVRADTASTPSKVVWCEISRKSPGPLW